MAPPAPPPPAHRQRRILYDTSALKDLGAPGVKRSVLFKSNATPMKLLGKDAAGHTFNAVARRQAGLDDPEAALRVKARAAAAAAAAELLAAEKEGDNEKAGDAEYVSKKKKKKRMEEEKVDFYELLGLGEERWLATDQQIKDGYRVAALKNHPDKCGAAMATHAVKEQLEERFRNIQKAYEVLSDVDKRRAYDSTSEDFDDTLPETCKPSDFLKTFGEAFKRQSRWSAVTPVPTAGWREESAWEELEDFYDFWFRFSSWREFPHDDEEDLDQAESREHKRYMERINSKLREKAKKEETRRIAAFVEAAYKLDPRVVAAKAAEKQAKAAAKGSKHAAKRDEEERKAKAEAEAKEAAEVAAALAKEADAAAKKEREKAKKEVRKLKARVRAAVAPSVEAAEASSDAVESLCDAADASVLKQLADDLDVPGAAVAALLAAATAAVAAAGGGNTAGGVSAGAANGNGAHAAPSGPPPPPRPWSDDESKLLDRALLKYPTGVARRWEQVTAFVGGTRTLVDVMAAVKARMSLAATAPGAKGGKGGDKQGDAFSKFQKELTAKRAHVSGSLPAEDLRAHAFSDVNVKLAGAAAAAAAPAGATVRPATAPATKGGPAAAKANKENGAQDEPWPEAMTNALVKALKAFPKGSAADEKTRWARIASAVPGKSPQECFRQFTDIRTQVKAKKDDAPKGAAGDKAAAETAPAPAGSADKAATGVKAEK